MQKIFPSGLEYRMLGFIYIYIVKGSYSEYVKNIYNSITNQKV